MLVTGMGKTLEVPTVQAQRIALCLLLDDVRGSGRPFTADQLGEVKLTLKGISKIGNRVKFTISGSFAAEDQERGKRCVVEGIGLADLAARRILQFNLAAQMQCWGEDMPTGDGQPLPYLGMSLHRVESVEGTHRIVPSLFDQYPPGWPVTE
jgi:hypothetical protein